MAEDMRKLLREAAPRPEREPDFEQLWERARRQRRGMQLAGAAGAAVVLALIGVALPQLAVHHPGNVQILDAPDTREMLRGRGQEFGSGETADGVPYVGRLWISEPPAAGDGEPRADQDLVCVALRIGDETKRVRTQGCGLLEQHLKNNRTIWTQSLAPARSGVAAWTPRKIDHAVWELSDEDLRVEASQVPGLPGSVFVIVIDGQPEQETEVVMYDAAGEKVGTIAVGVDTPAGDQVLFELGEASVWSSQPGSSLDQAVKAFVLQTLGWDRPGIEHDQPTDDPTRVLISGPSGQEIEALFDSTESGLWHVLQVGQGAGEVIIEPFALELATVPRAADHAELWIGRHGQTRHLHLDGQEFAGGRVDLNSLGLAYPEDIVAALIIYLDEDGKVLEAHGEHYAAEVAP